MTETGTLTLIDFLLARIAEDEEVAMRAAATTGGGHWEVRSVPYEGIWICEAGGWWPEDAWPGDECDHAARHDPARVLLDCAAKRRTVERCMAVDYGLPAAHLAHGTLAEMAVPYADHPDFREEWRP